MDKLSAIERIKNSLNEDYKKRSTDPKPLVSLAADIKEELEPVYIPTNIPQLNDDLGGGVVRGSSTVFHGEEASGKTATSLSILAELTRRGEYVLYINTENLFPVKQALMVGLVLDKVIYVPAKDNAETIIDTIDAFLYDKEGKKPSGLIGGVCIDSINGLIPKVVADKAEEEGSAGNPQMARRAKLLDDLCARLQGRGMLRSENGVVFLFVVQDRFDPNSYGNPKKMSGGMALLYNPKVRIAYSKKFNTIKGKTGDKIVDIPVGHTCYYNIEKNNIECRLAKGEYSVSYGIGVDNSAKVNSFLEELGFIGKIERKPAIWFGDHDLCFSGGVSELKSALRADLNLRKDCERLIDSFVPGHKPMASGNKKIYGDGTIQMSSED